MGVLSSQYINTGEYNFREVIIYGDTGLFGHTGHLINYIISLDNTFDFNNPVVIPPDEEANPNKDHSKGRAKQNLIECD